MPLINKKIPILSNINDTPSTAGQPNHPNASLLCKNYNDVLEELLYVVYNGFLNLPQTESYFCVKVLTEGDGYVYPPLQANCLERFYNSFFTNEEDFLIPVVESFSFQGEQLDLNQENTIAIGTISIASDGEMTVIVNPEYSDPNNRESLHKIEIIYSLKDLSDTKVIENKKIAVNLVIIPKFSTINPLPIE